MAVKTGTPKHEKMAHDLQRVLPRATSLLEQSRRSAHENSRDRRKQGKAMRQEVPLASHAEYEAAPDRPDPVALLQSQDDVRIASLVPIRFGRMAASPFSFNEIDVVPASATGEADLGARVGPDRIPMFVHTPGKQLRILTAGDRPALEAGQELIGLLERR